MKTSVVDIDSVLIGKDLDPLGQESPVFRRRRAKARVNQRWLVTMGCLYLPK